MDAKRIKELVEDSEEQINIFGRPSLGNSKLLLMLVKKHSVIIAQATAHKMCLMCGGREDHHKTTCSSLDYKRESKWKNL